MGRFVVFICVFLCACTLAEDREILLRQIIRDLRVLENEVPQKEHVTNVLNELDTTNENELTDLGKPEVKDTDNTEKPVVGPVVNTNGGTNVPEISESDISEVETPENTEASSTEASEGEGIKVAGQEGIKEVGTKDPKIDELKVNEFEGPEGTEGIDPEIKESEIVEEQQGTNIKVDETKVSQAAELDGTSGGAEFLENEKPKFSDLKGKKIDEMYPVLPKNSENKLEVAGNEISKMLQLLSEAMEERATQLRQKAQEMTPDISAMAVAEERFETAAAELMELREQLARVLSKIYDELKDFNRIPEPKNEAKEEDSTAKKTSMDSKILRRLLAKLRQNHNM